MPGGSLTTLSPTSLPTSQGGHEYRLLWTAPWDGMLRKTGEQGNESKWKWDGMGWGSSPTRDALSSGMFIWRKDKSQKKHLWPRFILENVAHQFHLYYLPTFLSSCKAILAQCHLFLETFLDAQASWSFSFCDPEIRCPTQCFLWLPGVKLAGYAASVCFLDTLKSKTFLEYDHSSDGHVTTSQNSGLSQVRRGV